LARGRNSLHRVPRVTYTTYAVRDQTGRLHPMEARFARTEALSATKSGIAGCMSALAVSRCSLMSWCSWSKRPPPRNSCS
jgi:hypothetical protein